ncbi:MAG: signal peptidase I [Candidatus Methanoperedens sp.]|nr:signal peptidase I [Candidatus Methanoperedens sp.]
MLIPINLILLFLTISIFLVLIYLRVSHHIDITEPVKIQYREFYKRNREKSFISLVGKRPEDTQKMIFKESLILVVVVFIMFAVASKVIFFTAVVSGSMVPTFSRGDLVLMQNIDHTYRVGDIIMFNRPDTNLPYAHRILYITKDGIVTKGDASNQKDWWRLKNRDIIGKAILIGGKPIVLKGYGSYFIVSDRNQDLGPFGNDYRKYQLFFQVVKLYGYVIAAFCLFLYILLTVRKKPSQN